MSDVNLLILSGNVAADPEARYSESGNMWVTFSIGTNSRNKNEERTEWTNCVAFGKTAETIQQYFKKGLKVLVTGEKQTSKYTDTNTGNVRESVKCLIRSFNFLTPRTPPTGAAPAAQHPPTANQFDGPPF